MLLMQIFALQKINEMYHKVFWTCRNTHFIISNKNIYICMMQGVSHHKQLEIIAINPNMVSWRETHWFTARAVEIEPPEHRGGLDHPGTSAQQCLQSTEQPGELWAKLGTVLSDAAHQSEPWVCLSTLWLHSKHPRNRKYEHTAAHLHPWVELWRMLLLRLRWKGQMCEWHSWLPLQTPWASDFVPDRGHNLSAWCGSLCTNISAINSTKTSQDFKFINIYFSPHWLSIYSFGPAMMKVLTLLFTAFAWAALLMVLYQGWKSIAMELTEGFYG